MEENLETSNEVKNELSDKTNKSNSEEIKEVKSEKDFNMNGSNSNSQNNSAPKFDKKNENNTPSQSITKPIKEPPIEKNHSKNL